LVLAIAYAYYGVVLTFAVAERARLIPPFSHTIASRASGGGAADTSAGEWFGA
jgi:hypothetical protein